MRTSTCILRNPRIVLFSQFLETSYYNNNNNKILIFLNVYVIFLFVFTEHFPVHVEKLGNFKNSILWPFLSRLGAVVNVENSECSDYREMEKYLTRV